MVVSGTKQNHRDHTFFMDTHSRGVIVLLVYVDDFIVTGNDWKEQ